jgi:hypothetical protein
VHGDYQVFLGLDVGKDGHHAVALDRDGKRLHDAALVNSEAKLRQVFDKLIHPALERAFGKNLAHKAGLELLSRCGGPAGIRKAGRRKLLSIASKNAPRMGERLVERIMTALDEQSVVVPGTVAAETVLTKLADSLREALRQRDELAAQVEEILDAHPLAEVLT